MSRIGKLPIPVPKGVDIKWTPEKVSVKGPLGLLEQDLKPGFTFEREGDDVTLTRPDDAKSNRALHGLYRSLISNMAHGVSKGFELKMELVGVGYRAEAKGQNLELSLGFSHGVLFQVPSEVKVATEVVKGQNPRIILNSIDKQLVGQVAAKLRAIRPPEPYKGKGIKFVDEVIRRKAGKTSGKGKK
jgi:large subunit ribosomal protein L6